MNNYNYEFHLYFAPDGSYYPIGYDTNFISDDIEQLIEEISIYFTNFTTIQSIIEILNKHIKNDELSKMEDYSYLIDFYLYVKYKELLKCFSGTFNKGFTKDTISIYEENENGYDVDYYYGVDAINRIKEFDFIKYCQKNILEV